MEELKKQLRAAAITAKQRNSGTARRSDDELFAEEYLRAKNAKDGVGDCELIPTFFRALPPEEDVLRQKLREEARAEFLQRRSKALLDNEELKRLWTLLDSNATPSPAASATVGVSKDPAPGASSSSSPSPESGGGGGSGSGEQMIGYEEYKKVSKLAGEKCRPFFTAMVFAKLQQGDPHGRVSVMAFFNYVMRKVWLHQTRIGLSLYDVTGQGHLREQDLENYIAELIHTLPQLDGLEKSFHNFYTCTAVRKFFFFLDPLRTGKIRIQDILASSFLDELLELRDQDLAKDVQEGNWFSAPSALRVYGVYLNLDQDHNGMLSKSELLKYGTGTLTPAFIDRVFQECLTYEGEMDYKTYLDFVLALENRKEPQSLQYYFRILDVRQQGHIDAFTLNFFFRDIIREMEKHNQEPVKFEDVKDEIFDMVRPEDPLRITLKDLISCGNGDTVVSILVDLNGFWTYENREVLISDPESSDM